jgi:hypothetical protein
MNFALPSSIAKLVSARNSVRDFYATRLGELNTNVLLKFTLDGNLVGDLGEALAAEMFGLRLVSTRSTAGIDGLAPDGKTTVQVKATGTGRGPAFRWTEMRADHLLFFDLDLEAATGSVVYNGPEHRAIACLPSGFPGQRSLTRAQIRAADLCVLPHERLPRV